MDYRDQANKWEVELARRSALYGGRAGALYCTVRLAERVGTTRFYVAQIEGTANGNVGSPGPRAGRGGGRLLDE